MEENRETEVIEEQGAQAQEAPGGKFEGQKLPKL